MVGRSFFQLFLMKFSVMILTFGSKKPRKSNFVYLPLIAMSVFTACFNGDWSLQQVIELSPVFEAIEDCSVADHLHFETLDGEYLGWDSKCRVHFGSDVKVLVKTALGMTEIIKVLELRKFNQGDTLPYKNVVKKITVVDLTEVNEVAENNEDDEGDEDDEGTKRRRT